MFGKKKQIQQVVETPVVAEKEKKKYYRQIIESVDVVGSDNFYKVGVAGVKEIISSPQRMGIDDVFVFFNDGRPFVNIRNCPVVIRSRTEEYWA